MELSNNITTPIGLITNYGFCEELPILPLVCLVNGKYRQFEETYV